MALSTNKRITNSRLLWKISNLYLVLYIGFRHEVGGDWSAYLEHFERVSDLNLYEVLVLSDPGYYLINLFVSELGLTVHYVNLVCASIFVYGLSKFVKYETNKWLFVMIALPYTINIVAMGYTRQAVALGLVLAAVTFLREKKYLKYILAMILAVLFHKTAVIMVGLGVFSSGKNKYLKIFAIGLIGIGLYQVFLAEQLDHLMKDYVDAQMQSEGAKIRTFMNLIPALILIIFRKKWKLYFDDFNFWFIIALLSILSFIMVDKASTAVDRIALYFIPIQMIVFGRLHILLKGMVPTAVVNLSIAIYYFLVLFVWLFFAKTAFAWIPYQNYLFYNIF